MQLHLNLYLLGQSRELNTEQSRDADGTIVAPDTLCPVLHIQLQALQRIGDVVVQTTGSLDEFCSYSFSVATTRSTFEGKW